MNLMIDVSLSTTKYCFYKRMRELKSNICKALFLMNYMITIWELLNIGTEKNLC